VASICAWARNNIGLLNSLIHSNYQVDQTTYELLDGTSEIGSQELGIYQLLYEINYFTRQQKNTLGIGGIDLAIEVSADGSTVKRVNRNEISKSWSEMKRTAMEQLNKLVNLYRYNSASSGAQSIDGDDIIVENTSDRYGSNLVPGFGNV
jgi:hypothetical protein